MAVKAIRQHACGDATAGMCLLFEELNVFADLFLGVKVKGKRAHANGDGIPRKQISDILRQWRGGLPIAAPSLALFSPIPRHALIIGHH